MIIDVHAHSFGSLESRPGQFVRNNGTGSFVFRLLVRRLSRLAPGVPPAELGAALETRILSWIAASRVDRVVLLALDKAYHRDGTPDWAATRLAVDNDAIADCAARNPKVLFGASVHPFRPDALAELDRLAARGACLVKWLPSAQNIVVDDPACFPFYDRLAALRLPLLTHTGVEHTLPAFSDALNDPRLLKPALDRGVVVIAAHCGTRMFLHERSYFAAWQRMARDYPHFYGDLGGFGLPVHWGALSALRRDQNLMNKVVFASDFPALTEPYWYLPQLGLARCRELRRIENPFDKAYLTLKYLGLPDDVFERAERLLRTPANPGARRDDQ